MMILSQTTNSAQPKTLSNTTTVQQTPGTLARRQPTYTAEAEAYREKVQAFLAEKLPADWQGIGALEGDARRQVSARLAARLRPRPRRPLHGRTAALVARLLVHEDKVGVGRVERGVDSDR